ncbi:hypothetical protein Ae168Ps1_1124 [Pseudonocardia sp. Ae168_Ps1]|nr:hypothetical protein Ae150APs1_1123 [Pseudonocardia sp. Ae150A_Ps1]OLL78718.1 hypothetical protein Ae168Ps1_1124 [Pseudonocardia sp. Ae168_Ps1]OLL87154.1 hypothetical protein Ae263Ps1_4209c [Pseudonocardia sp. Ae263_Ps1]
MARVVGRPADRPGGDAGGGARDPDPRPGPRGRARPVDPDRVRRTGGGDVLVAADPAGLGPRGPAVPGPGRLTGVRPRC